MAALPAPGLSTSRLASQPRLSPPGPSPASGCPMSVSLVVIRLELAEHSPVPAGFGFSAAVGEMSDEEIQKKTLASAVACLEGKSPGEKAAIIHQHLGRREMTDVIIETMKANPGWRKCSCPEDKDYFKLCSKVR